MKIGLKIVSIMAAAALFGACGSEDKEILEPDLVSKADFADRVEMKGRLDFGAEAKDSFTQDLEFHAYTIYATTGSVIGLEVTQAGTARDLDTTLFVYGPQDAIGNPGERLAHDDDSGWGSHSKLTGLTLGRLGNYTVVVGTADGMGRGNYRLVLDCESTECVPADTPVVLTKVEAPTELEDLLADAQMPSYAYAYLYAFKWSGYYETPSYDQIREPLAEWWMGEYEWEDDDLPWEDEDELYMSHFDEDLAAYGIDISDFNSAAGLSVLGYRVIRASYQFTCYMGVTCWESIYMIISWDSDDVYVLTLGAGEE